MTFNPEAGYDAANINSSLGERVIKSHLISKSSIEIQSCSNLVEGMTLSESGGIWNSDSPSNNRCETPLEVNSKDDPEETLSRDVNTFSASTDAAQEDKSKHTEAHVRRGDSEGNFEGVATCEDKIEVVAEDPFLLTNRETDEEFSEESSRLETFAAVVEAEVTDLDEEENIVVSTSEIEENGYIEKSLYMLDATGISAKSVATFVTVKEYDEVHTSLVTSKCPQTDESVNTSVTQVTIYDGPSDEETTMTSTAVLAESEVVISSRASSCGSSASVEEFRVHGAASIGSLEAPRLLSSLPPRLIWQIAW